MRFHWKVLVWMVAGVAFGLGLQGLTEGRATAGASWAEPVAEAAGGAPAGVLLERVEPGGPIARANDKSDGAMLMAGERVTAAVLSKGSDRERRLELGGASELRSLVEGLEPGSVLWLEDAGGEEHLITLELDPGSVRASWIRPFDFVADLFMALLRMLIVPIVFASIISGVASVGSFGDLRRLGTKTFVYYMSTSLLAILVGQLLVDVIRPGEGAQLGLARLEAGEAPKASFVEVLERMIPQNVFAALGDNGAMLSIIFFALLFGYCVTQAPSPHRERLSELFESAFQVMLRMAESVLKLLPYGVFCLMVRVVAKTGFGVFEPLLVYMLTVVLALGFHSLVTLPVLLKLVGGIHPLRWFQAMSPALMTAFSTSSSSMTLPVTLETVEKRGRVSNKVTSFTLPLGATINMDGTALYECIGVIFLAQYYGSISPDFVLTWGDQALVVMMALMASVGAAGIPSAGLVMMLAILAALGLPLEGAALLLAVDRPLDMLRTTVNVWSDTCGAAIVARSEGEQGPLEAGGPEPGGTGPPALSGPRLRP